MGCWLPARLCWKVSALQLSSSCRELPSVEVPALVNRDFLLQNNQTLLPEFKVEFSSAHPTMPLGAGGMMSAFRVQLKGAKELQKRKFNN